MEEEKRRVNLLKQRIGLPYFPSTRVREAGVVHEGNLETWALLKRAEETYLAELPLLPTAAGNVKVGKAVLAAELIRQSIASMRELTTLLLGESEAAWEIVAELTRRVEDYIKSEAKKPSGR